MANYYAARRLREELAAAKPVAAPPPLPEPFTDADWYCAQIAREAIDAMAICVRWKVTCVPADGAARTYYLSGLLDNVERRSALIFGFQTRVLAIEPAPGRGESYDRRFNLSGEI